MNREALLREAARALRSGEIELAAELAAVAGDVDAPTLTREELAILSPEFWRECSCGQGTP